MKKSTKIALITAAVLILTGSMLFAGVMEKLDWDMEKLSTVEYVTNTHVIDEAFESINVKTKTAGIALRKAEDGVCLVECQEESKAMHRVTVENGVLTIEMDDQRKLKDMIGIVSGNHIITIFLPDEAYDELHIESTTGGVDVPAPFTFENVSICVTTGGAAFHANASGHVEIKATTGAIRVEDAKAKSMHLKVNTGAMTVKNVTCEETLTADVTTGRATVENADCKNFVSDGNTGDLHLLNVIAEEKMDIERTTGDVELTECDAKEIKVETDTGDVTGSLLSGKKFSADSDTGRVRVPGDEAGGRCQIETDTGDIDITVK